MLHKTRIIAGIAGYGTAFKFVNDFGQSVQKVAVMGNDQNCAAVGTQVLFQPGQIIQIKVVGGFVQDQQIRFSQEAAG